jgi:hypothetical protein
LKYSMRPSSCFARNLVAPSLSRLGLARQGGGFLFGALLIATLLTCAAFARAQTLSGTVTNGTTGKPAAGDNVVLLDLSQGMNEAARTKTDAQGKFSFNVPPAAGPRLVRVNHEGVNYFPAGGPIRPGATTTEVQVYDVAKKLNGVSDNVRVMRLQADQNSLQVIELISVKNSSSPPRSLMSDRTYEIVLPEGAQIDESVAQAPGGMPVNSAPVPDDKLKGNYYFVFPIRPGETRFQVAYHLPYSGEATLKPKIHGRLEHFAVMLPKSMEFGAKSPGVYSPTDDQSGQSTLQVVTGVTPDKDLTFRVAGTGALADQQPNQGQGGEQQADAGGAMGGGTGPRPGGGIGTPEGTPDPIHKYRWAILAGCLVLLAAGGSWVATRSQSASPKLAAAAAVADPVMPVIKAQPVARAVFAEPVQIPVPRSGMLLEGLKEELFQLEVERQQGRISEAEYLKTKSALDQTLQRALSRSRTTQS